MVEILIVNARNQEDTSNFGINDEKEYSKAIHVTSWTKGSNVGCRHLWITVELVSQWDLGADTITLTAFNFHSNTTGFQNFIFASKNRSSPLFSSWMLLVQLRNILVPQRFTPYLFCLSLWKGEMWRWLFFQLKTFFRGRWLIMFRRWRVIERERSANVSVHLVSGFLLPLKKNKLIRSSNPRLAIAYIYIYIKIPSSLFMIIYKQKLMWQKFTFVCRSCKLSILRGIFPGSLHFTSYKPKETGERCCCERRDLLRPRAI